MHTTLGTSSCRRAYIGNSFFFQPQCQPRNMAVQAAATADIPLAQLQQSAALSKPPWSVYLPMGSSCAKGRTQDLGATPQNGWVESTATSYRSASQNGVYGSSICCFYRHPSRRVGPQQGRDNIRRYLSTWQWKSASRCHP